MSFFHKGHSTIIILFKYWSRNTFTYLVVKIRVDLRKRRRTDSWSKIKLKNLAVRLCCFPFPVQLSLWKPLCRWQCLAVQCLERDPGLLPREGICLQVHEKDSKQGGWWRTLAAPRNGDRGNTDCRDGRIEKIHLEAEEGKYWQEKKAETSIMFPAGERKGWDQSEDLHEGKEYFKVFPCPDCVKKVKGCQEADGWFCTYRCHLCRWVPLRTPPTHWIFYKENLR